MELDDEFSLDSKEQVQGSKVAQSKSMKTVYEELTQKALKKQHNAKPVKKQKLAKIQKDIKQENNSAKAKKLISKPNGDNSCRYIKNWNLEAQLKQKALSGVLKIMNMISKTQAERKVE